MPWKGCSKLTPWMVLVYIIWMIAWVAKPARRAAYLTHTYSHLTLKRINTKRNKIISYLSFSWFFFSSLLFSWLSFSSHHVCSRFTLHNTQNQGRQTRPQGGIPNAHVSHLTPKRKRNKIISYLSFSWFFFSSFLFSWFYFSSHHVCSHFMLHNTQNPGRNPPVGRHT